MPTPTDFHSFQWFIQCFFLFGGKSCFSCNILTTVIFKRKVKVYKDIQTHEPYKRISSSKNYSDGTQLISFYYKTPKRILENSQIVEKNTGAPFRSRSYKNKVKAADKTSFYCLKQQYTI